MKQRDVDGSFEVQWKDQMTGNCSTQGTVGSATSRASANNAADIVRGKKAKGGIA
jgi:hypothetical protein